MSKTKKQLRAEAVERLSALDALEMYDLRDFAIAIMGDAYNGGCWNLRDALIDLLTDDEPPYDGLINCLWNDYGIKASWDGLRKFWNVEWHVNLDCPSDPGEAAMMSMNAFISEHSDESCGQHADQGERDDGADCESCDLREKLEADVRQKELDIANVKLVGKPDCDICDRTTLLEEIEGLTAERDKLRAECDKDVLVMVDELDRWKTRAIKLEAERDELQAKVDQLEREVQWWSDDKDIVIKQNVELQEQVVTLEREREEMRSRLGKVMDALQEAQRAGDIP